MIKWLVGWVAIATFTSCSTTSHSQDSIEAQQWQKMAENETAQAWNYVLNSPLGIAALNQLAVEGFISPQCPKTLYTSQQYGSFQFLLRVQCPTARGVSTAVEYEEIQVIFNRFEDNIEDFQVERVSSENSKNRFFP